MKFIGFIDHGEKSLAPFSSPPLVNLTLLCLWTLLPLVLAVWPRAPYYHYIAENQTPASFLIVHTATLLLTAYFSLLCGRGELVTPETRLRLIRENVTTQEEENRFLSRGLVGFTLHTAFILLLLMPALVVSAHISGMPPEKTLAGPAVIFLTSLLCRLFSFWGYIVFGRTSLFGYYLARFFYLVLILGPLAGPDYVSPLRMLYRLHTGPGFPAREMGLFALMTGAAAMLLIAGISGRLAARKKAGGTIHG